VAIDEEDELLEDDSSTVEDATVPAYSYWQDIGGRANEIATNAGVFDKVKAVLYRTSPAISLLSVGWNTVSHDFGDDDGESLRKRIRNTPDEMRSYYYNCRTHDDYDRVTDFIVQDHAHRQIEGEMSGFASIPLSLAAFVVDPSNKPLLAVAGAAATAVAGIGAAMSAPLLVTGAAAAAAGAGVFVGLDSALKSVLQPSKKLEEAPQDAAFGAAIGVAFKGIHEVISKYRASKNIAANERFAKIKEHIRSSLPDDRPHNLPDELLPSPVPPNTYYLSFPIKKGSYKIAHYDRFKYFKWLLTNSVTGSPLATGMLSRFKTLNEATYIYVNHTLPTENLGEGAYSSVEGLMKTIKGKMFQIDLDTLEHFTKYQKRTGRDQKTFNENIYGAILEGGKHSDSEVQTVAQIYVKELSEAVDFAQSKGIELLPVTHDPMDSFYLNEEELRLDQSSLLNKLTKDKGKTQVSYFPRAYDVYAVERDYKNFANIIKQSELKNFVLDELGKIESEHVGEVKKLMGWYDFSKAKDFSLFSEEELTKLDTNLQRQLADTETRKSKLMAKIFPNDKFITKLAEEKVKTIINAGLNDGVGVEYVKQNGGLSMQKARTVLVDDRLLAPYLIRDPKRILKKTLNQLYFRAYEAQVLKAFGHKNFDAMIKALENENAEFIKKTTGEKELVKLNNEFIAAKRLLLDLPHMVKGTGTNVQQNPRLQMSIDLLRKWNYSRLMGEVGLASFDDVGNVVNAFGTRETVGAALKEIGYLISNTLVKKAGGAVGIEASLEGVGEHMRNTWRQIGVAMEGAAADAMRRFDNSYIDVHELTHRISPVERKIWEKAHWTIDKATQLTNKLSGIEMWTDFWKSVNGQMYVDKVCRIFLKDNPSGEDLKYLAKHRIPTQKKYLAAIRKQIVDHGEVFDDLVNPNLDSWTDRKARDIFGASIVANSNATILTPISGDTPAWFNNAFGKLLIQFKHITFSMLHNITMRYISGDGNNYVQALAWYIAANCLSKYIKSITANNPYDLQKPDLYVDTLINLPIFSYIGDLAKSGLEIYRYAENRGIVDSAFNMMARMSPSLSLLNFSGRQLTRIAGIDGKPMSEYHLRQMFYMLPFATVSAIKFMGTTAVERHVSSSGGKKMKRRKDS
jgi:hypothetical protein